MQRLFVVAALYIIVLQAVLSYTVPAVEAAGLTAFAASLTYFAINVTAMISRVAWGHVADRDGGSRRTRTLVEVGAVAAVGAVLFTLSLHVGTAFVVLGAVLFGFGALGWNALVYVSAGERAPPELAARSVAVAATVVFLLSAISTPLLGALAEAAGWDIFWIVTGLLAAAGVVRRRRRLPDLRLARALLSPGPPGRSRPGGPFHPFGVPPRTVRWKGPTGSGLHGPFPARPDDPGERLAITPDEVALASAVAGVRDERS